MDSFTGYPGPDPWETIRSLGLNDTQSSIFLEFYNNQTQVANNTQFHMLITSAIPFLVETIVLGTVFVAALLLAYTHLQNKGSWRHIAFLAIGVGMFTAHWILTYRVIILFAVVCAFCLPGGFMMEEEFICETVLFGALTGLVIFVAVLFSKSRNVDGRSSSSWTLSRRFPFGVLMITYIAAAVHWGLGIWAGIEVQLASSAGYAARYDHLQVATSVALSLSVVCSDVVVLWRACAIWMNRRSIVLLSVSLISATAISSIGNIALIAQEKTSGIGTEASIKLPNVANIPLSTIPGFISLGLSIFANVFATLAIGYKAWKHRALVRKHLGVGSRRLMTERIMCIFVESGVVYICLWILYVLATTAFDAVPGLGPYSYSMIQLTAIYPALIIALVFLEKKSHLAKDLTISTLPLSGHITIVTMIHSTPSDLFNASSIGDDVELGRSEPAISRQDRELEDFCEG